VAAGFLIGTLAALVVASAFLPVSAFLEGSAFFGSAFFSKTTKTHFVKLKHN